MTLDLQTFDSLTVPADSSAAAEIAAAVRGPQGVQHQLRRHPCRRHHRRSVATVLIAGDNTQAKALLADVVTAAGLRAIDVAALRRARELEALGFLQITLATQQKMPWTGGFAVAA